MGLTKFIVVLFVWVLLLFCGGSKGLKRKSIKQIRVINNTEHVFTNVSLFSMPFKTLYPGDTSEYKELVYDPLKDDPLIYCVSNQTNYGRYLIIPKGTQGEYTYRIDSIQDGMIFLSFGRDNP